MTCVTSQAVMGGEEKIKHASLSVVHYDTLRDIKIYNRTQCSLIVSKPARHPTSSRSGYFWLISCRLTSALRGFSSASTVRRKRSFKKNETIVECLLMSSHVPTLKQEVEQQLLTWKRLFHLLQETNKQPFPAY